MRREHLVTGVLALAAFAAQAVAFRGMRFDDAFITYRYGQNLATGHGLTFNPGEPFLGSTSPGHMFLSALAYAVFGLTGTPSALAALGCLGWTTQALAVRWLLRPALGALGSALVAGLVALGAACSFRWVSLETNVLAALLVAAFCAARARRWHWTAALCAGACLMRPDAALMALVLGVECLRDRRARALGPAALFTGLVFPWLLFATSYYGSPLPQSAITKLQRTPFPEYFVHLLRSTADALLPLTPMPVAYLLWLAGASIVAGAFVLARRDRIFGVALVYLALHALAYLMLRPIAGHDWHLYPITLFATLFALGGIVVLATAQQARALRACGWMLLVTFGALCALRTRQASLSQDTDLWTGARDATYRQVAAYLLEHGRAADRFASVEVGTLAYYTQMPAYDLGGLVTNLRDDPMPQRHVRWLVLDKLYLQHAPPIDPVFIAVNRDFEAYVFELPEQ